MSPLVRNLTTAVLALPIVFAVSGLGTSGPERPVLLWAAASLVLLCAAVWLCARPRAFEVTPEGLVIVWPTRRRLVLRSEIAGARILTRPELRAEFGWAVRIGVGGLWGGFGWAWTSRRGLLDLYVSRADYWVLVECRSARPLLLSPERPEEFVRALR